MISVGLAVPFTLGIVTAINPCGFAMLPTWLGYFLGRDTADRHARPEQVVRAVSVSLTLSAAFVILFGALGLAVNSITSEATIADKTPWVTVILGLCLVPYGLTLLTGRQVRIPFFKPGRGPRDREFWSVVGFGTSYAVVSISCSAPIFLLHVAGSFGRDGIVNGIAVYLAYAAGMAAVITSLTLSLALARGGLARHLRRLLPHFDRIGALALLLGGTYLIVYGIYEIRLLRNPGTPSNPVVDAVTDLQSHLATWVTTSGGTRVGLALWLVVLTIVVWGVRPVLTQEARRTAWTITGMVWLVAEGAGHRLSLIHI